MSLESRLTACPSGCVLQSWVNRWALPTRLFVWIRDQVIAEVAQAYSRARYRKEQMEYAQQQVIAAADALPLNLNGIRDGVIRPIEAQQAIAGLAAARSLYLAAVIDFNQAQLELIRALGEPPQG